MSSLPRFVQTYTRYKYSAQSRGIDFTISIEEFSRITSSLCEYCGSSPIAIKGGRYKPLGVDRVDNSVGYISGNCVPCCSVCNYAKGSMTVHEFEDWIHKAHHHLLKN